MKPWIKNFALLALVFLSSDIALFAADINGELKNALLEKRASDPSGSGNVSGRVYYDTTNNVAKFYNGSAWRTITDTTTALINPMDSTGDLIYGGAAGVATKLDSGTANYVLQANGAASPTWVNTLYMSAGSAGSPSYSFSGDSNTGMFSSASDQVTFTTAGTTRVFINSSGLTMNSGQVQALAGTAALPAISFDNDANTGIYNPGTDQLGFAVGGTEHFEVNTGGVLLTQSGTQIRGAAGAGGTASTPDFSWAGDNDTGMYSDAANQIRFTSGGDLKMTLNDAGGSGQYRLDLASTNTTLASGTILGRQRVVSSDASNTGAIGSEIRTVSNNSSGSSTRLELWLANAGTNDERARLDETGLLTLDAGVQANGTGGNVPHNCARESTSGASTTSQTHTCSGSKMLVGGGCDAAGVALTRCRPSTGSPPSTWDCATATSTTIVAYAICCDF